MYNRKIARAILYFLIIILVSQTALALGVSPGKKFIDFEPNLKATVTFDIVNNEQKDLKLLISPRGDLVEYVVMKETLVLIDHDEGSKSFSFDIALPQKIEKPGSHKIEIVITEFGENEGEEDSAIVTALPSVVHELIVRVPYPGKYAEAKLQITPANINESVRFVVTLFNLGLEDIKSAKAKITIFEENETVANFETSEISLQSKKDGKLEASWLAEVSAGIYTAKAIVTYDDKTTEVQREFEVGSLIVDIDSVEVLDFRLGDVARFDIYLQSKWNKRIDNVYADLTITGTGEDTKEYGKSKTASVSIPPLSTKRVRAYWDTEGVGIGEYNILIILHYADQTKERIIKAQVNIDSIRTSLSPTGQVIIREKGTRTRDTFLFLLIGVLIGANVFWFVYLKKRMKK